MESNEYCSNEYCGNTIEAGYMRLVGGIIRQALIDAKININEKYFNELDREYKAKNARNDRIKKRRKALIDSGAIKVNGQRVKLIHMSKKRSIRYNEMRTQKQVKEDAMEFLFGRHRLESFLAGVGLNHSIKVDSLRRGFRQILEDKNWKGGVTNDYNFIEEDIKQDE